ncbi:50S ribosomal protein L23 [uncultured archaeon]|nr:50S ribosomal protein L23 [uncultured archaeon]
MIKSVLNTEKAVALAETQNRLVFVVSRDSTKAGIKKEVETDYTEKVKNVNTYITARGEKRAVVVFQTEKAASKIAAKLKII